MKKQNIIVLTVLAVFSLAIPLLIGNPYFLQYLINMLLFAYLATAWNIIGGYAGQMAQGNGVYFGIGAYVSTILFVYEDVSPWIGMISMLNSLC